MPLLGGGLEIIMKHYGLMQVLLAFLLSVSLPANNLVAKTSDINSEQSLSECSYYVALTGDDNNIGSNDAPFATLTRAKNAIRERKEENGLPKGGINVYLMDGTYYMASGLTFTEEDSGTKDCPITYCAYGDAEVTLQYAITLKGKDFAPISDKAKKRLRTKSAKKNVVQLNLTQYGLTREDWGKLYAFGSYNTAAFYKDAKGPIFCRLYVNNKAATLARYPNEGFLKIGKVYNEGTILDGKQPGDIRYPKGGTFAFNNEVKKHIKSWKSLKDVWMYGYYYYDWADSSIPVKSVNLERNSLTTAQSSFYGFQKDARYYFFNVFEELDSENEWYLNRNTGMLYLYTTKDVSQLELSLALSTDDAVTVDHADYLTFKNINIKGTKGNGFVINGDYNCVNDCTICNISGGGVSAKGEENRVTDCTIYNIGSYGIILYGGDREKLTSCNSIASNNLIYHWAEIYTTYKAAVEANGVGITISHNEIYDAPHVAILYYGNNNIIEYNDIHDVCKETSDAGAIYAGRDWTCQGNVIRYNSIRDIKSAAGSPNGIYWDDCLSGQTAYGNILMNIGGAGFLIGGGRDNSIEENLIYDAEYAIYYDDRGREGIVYNGWYAGNVNPMDGVMWVNLFRMPYRSEIWKESYPKLSQITTDLNRINDAAFPCNPAGSIVENNIIYDKNKEIGFITDSIYSYSTIGLNTIYGLKDNMLSTPLTYSDLEKMMKVPPQKIGRIK